jgi:hypothetical protein
MWCWRRIENIISMDLVQNVEELHIIKEEKNVAYKIKGKTAACIGHIFHRNCFLEHCTEGKIEG